jgi:hypothetical protein
VGGAATGVASASAKGAKEKKNPKLRRIVK